MMKTIVVPGEPVGKARPRFARHGKKLLTYTPEKTSEYESQIAWAYWKKYGSERYSGAVGLIVMAYLSIPKNVTKTKRTRMCSGLLKPTKKPDADNILKVVCDALNGVAYVDDAQVTSISIQKYYSDEPRIVITMYDDGEGIHVYTNKQKEPKNCLT